MFKVACNKDESQGHSRPLRSTLPPFHSFLHIESCDNCMKSETLAEVSPHAEPFGTQFHLLIIRHTEAFNQHSIIIPTYTAETYS